MRSRAAIAILFGVSLAMPVGAQVQSTESVRADEQAASDLETLQQRIEQLEQDLNDRMEAMADMLEQQPQQSKLSRVSLGGYGEMHYNAWDVDGTDFRQLDFHRLVFFIGYQFNPRARLVTELEIEHIISSAASRGAVELEQAYIEFDLKPSMRLRTGVMLVPVGIINETHEPPTFYGVERPILETEIVPTTWWVGGLQLVHTFDSGLRYDLMLSEGMKTEDPTSNVSARPFYLRGGKQKTSFADAFDLAVTARVAYTGIAGLQLSAYAQYQPDLDQSAEESYADSATLIGGHARYMHGPWTGTLMYIRWDLAGDAAADAGQELQHGASAELSWKPFTQWGFFARHSFWSTQQDMDAAQTKVGMSYFPFPNIVFKADVQMQNADATNNTVLIQNAVAGSADGFNLGFGYQF